MAPLTKILAFASLILLLLLTIIAGYSYAQIRTLSLPISQVFVITTIILPLVTALSTQTAYHFLRSHASYNRPVLCLSIFAFQLIYETIIATLSMTYMVPSCRLEEQWAKLYTHKEGDIIRRIQDRFNCCGLNTAVDRAWPFPHGKPEDGYGADQCTRMFGRGRSCRGPWRQAQQINSGLLFTVAITIFIFKVALIFFHRRNLSNWIRLFNPLTTGERGAHLNSRVNERLLISESNQVGVEDQYHDESQDENGNQPRVEPSVLVGSHGGEPWREEA